MTILSTVVTLRAIGAVCALLALALGASLLLGLALAALRPLVLLGRASCSRALFVVARLLLLLSVLLMRVSLISMHVDLIIFMITSGARPPSMSL